MSDADKPLTMEELADAKRYIEDRKASNNNGTYCLTYDGALRLIAAAERSIRRPIADAPMDGTAILAFCPTFYRGKGGHVVALFQDGDWWAVPGAFKIIPTHFYTIPGKGEM